ncbi:dTDP-4-dehydrorhamnose reductase [Streptomyces glaucescens]|uniref:dTDP-4-dehydrorhamnose reductase n=1 Tax=Streptomyces glaucescens TaxID=1907 RepID=A0A089WZS4_STRGA|nr:dTDP-4-dehydrorhamnose reductase [Streptomyces glaucescens]AIR96268.1 dTDP-4-dehydrorhamnose reductase [Streptomyces glaucescens]
MSVPLGSRWLVTGASGMLGRELTARLSRRGVPVVPLGRADLDVTDPAAARALLARHRPAVLVNCAAWTAVDAAEAHEARALAVNGEGPGHLARACRATGTRMIQLSTDYVFAGLADRPYREDDPPAPRTAYGRTKLAGERAVLDTLPDGGYVVRTAWLYGSGGANFVSTMIRLAAAEGTVPVVDDQHGGPTWTGDLADRLLALGAAALRGTAPPGVYHAVNAGSTTWHALAREIFRRAGADPGRVRPIGSGELARPAARPPYSVLAQGRWRAAGLAPLRDWRAALAEAFPALLRASARGGTVRR